MEALRGKAEATGIVAARGSVGERESRRWLGGRARIAVARAAATIRWCAVASRRREWAGAGETRGARAGSLGARRAGAAGHGQDAYRRRDDRGTRRGGASRRRDRAEPLG